MLEVERQKTNTLQADVLRLRDENLQISQSLDKSKEEVAQLQARCNEFRRHLKPTQYTRYEAYLSRAGWMHMEENQPGSATTGRGGVGTDDTTLIKVVEPSSCVLAGDRLPVHLNSPYSTAGPGDTRTNTTCSHVLVEEPEVEKDTNVSGRRKLVNLTSKHGLIF